MTLLVFGLMRFSSLQVGQSGYSVVSADTTVNKVSYSKFGEGSETVLFRVGADLMSSKILGLIVARMFEIEVALKLESNRQSVVEEPLKKVSHLSNSFSQAS